MKLEQSFEVSAPLERVWAALIDVEQVAPCLPGAAVTGRNEDGSFNGTFKVKIGPTAAAYSGKLHMDQVDESAHRAVMHAQGTDKRGQGGAKATIESSVSEAGAGTTRVQVVTDYHITGRLARFGRGGMIEEISNRLLTEFARSLQEMVAGDGEGSAPAPAQEAAPAGKAEPAQDAEIVRAPDAETEAAPAEAPTAVHAVPTVPADEPAAVGADPAEEAAEAAPAAAAKPEPAAAAEAAPAAEPVAAPEPAPVAAAPAPEPSRPTPPPPPPVESEPVNGLALMGSVAWSQAKRNPAPIVAVIVGFLVALRVFRRRGS